MNNQPAPVDAPSSPALAGELAELARLLSALGESLRHDNGVLERLVTFVAIGGGGSLGSDVTFPSSSGVLGYPAEERDVGLGEIARRREGTAVGGDRR